MKKSLSLIFCVLLSLTFLMPVFSVRKNYTYAETTAEESIEDGYFIEGNSQDLITKDINNSSIGDCKIETNVSPFDSKQKKKIGGNSITPTADDYGQFKNKSFLINSYTAAEDDVLFLWVYFFEMYEVLNYTYKLSISLTDNASSTITYVFELQQVRDFVKDTGSGWKLLAIKISDFDSEDEEEFYGETFSNLKLSFYSEASDVLQDPDATSEEKQNAEALLVKTNENLSFYHVFVTKNANFNQKSGKMVDLGGSYYKFSENFSIAQNLFVKDKIKIDSMNNIFEYLYVGKYDLSNYISTGKYKWVLTLKNPSSSSKTVELGKDIVFNESGNYYLSIVLLEVKTSTKKFEETFTIFCEEANLGYFVYGSNYKFKDNDTVELAFKLTKGLTIEDDYEITIDNNNAEIESYYEKDGVLYVSVSGKSSGSATIQISAKGHTTYNSKSQTFSATADIVILSTEEKVDVFMIILWTTFACFCIGIIIYLSISLVKARKNDVKWY